MTTSYNGFKAGDPSVFSPPGLDNSDVPGAPGVKLAPGVHKGDIATVLFYVAAQLHARVEPGVNGQCWGYAYRPSKNDASLISCHASATAFDWDAPAHANGKRGTFTKPQVTEIRKILAEVDNIVYWGGDAWGNGTPDEMHFEIAEGTTVMKITEVATKIKTAPPAPHPVDNAWYHGSIGTRQLQLGCHGDDVGNLQSVFNSRYPVYSNLTADGDFGPKTEAVAKEFQKRSKLVADGIVGPATFRALGF